MFQVVAALHRLSVGFSGKLVDRMNPSDFDAQLYRGEKQP
jgi:hypothetical protein